MSNEATNRVRDVWDRQAPAWFDQRESILADSRPVHEWLVSHLDPKPGQAILEIGAGPGDTGFLAARHLGKGRLLSTDLAPSMVDTARRRGRELGLENVEYRVLDAQSMDLDDSSFDGVICRWGFMLMPNPSAALRECRRVLVPGGRLVLSVFTGPDENPFASIPARILVASGHLPASSQEWEPGILALADRQRLQQLIDGSGFRSTQLEAVDMTWRFPDADAYWRFLIDITALGPLVARLPDSARDHLRSEVDERLSPFTHSAGIALPSRCWCGIAIK